MIAVRFTSRIPVSRLAAKTQTRCLSSQGSVAIEKLRGVLEEYRLQNYTQELPGRFKKDIMKAATKEDSDNIALESFSRVLTNIGAQNRLSKKEIKTIFEELGNGNEIPSQNMIKLL